MIKNSKGITLIALVITIIVMLIKKYLQRKNAEFNEILDPEYVRLLGIYSKNSTCFDCHYFNRGGKWCSLRNETQEASYTCKKFEER